MSSDVRLRLQRVRDEIERAISRSHRNDDVTLVAVSKTMPPDRIREAHAAGHKVFGENRVHEGAAKIAALRGQLPDASWHLIGHLQSNKVRQAAECFNMIESVDSVRLAGRLEAQCTALDVRLPILIEVNMAGESTKSGFAPDEVSNALLAFHSLPHLEVTGFMTIAPLVDDSEKVRPVFRRLRALRDELSSTAPTLDLHHLSMGMSNDFRVAIEEGATIVRLGRAIFGERP